MNSIRKTFATAIAAAALAASLSACSEPAGTQAPQAPASASQTVTEAPEAQAEVVPFGTTVTLPEEFGTQITIKKARQGVTDTYGGIEQKQSVVIFEITQKNVSDKPVNPANLLSATIDGAGAEETFSAVGESTGAPTTAIRPGKSVTWTAAYVGTMDQSWEMDLTVMPVDYNGDYNDPTNFSTVMFTDAG